MQNDNSAISRRQFLDVMAKGAVVTTAFSVILVSAGCGGGDNNDNDDYGYNDYNNYGYNNYGYNDY